MWEWLANPSVGSEGDGDHNPASIPTAHEAHG